MKIEAPPVPVTEDRARGKHILTLMTYLPVEDIRTVWAGMSKADRMKLFGHGHAEELDTFIKSLGSRDTGHLAGDAFGEKLQALHSGMGMDDHKASRVLHTASGVRMAQRAVDGPKKTGAQAHQTTMAILNARYKEKDSNGSNGSNGHGAGADLGDAVPPGARSGDEDSRDEREPALARDVPANAADEPGAGGSADREPAGGADQGVDSGGTARGSAAGDGNDGNGGTRRITGSADIPLTEDGEKQVAELAKKAVVPFDIVFCAPNQRSQETAQQFTGKPIEIKALDGWARGEMEGMPMEQAKPEVSKLILNPDMKPAGNSAESGKPGQSYNEALRPLLGEVRSVLRIQKANPQLHILFVTSGGNMQMVDAASKAGLLAEGSEEEQFKPELLMQLSQDPYWSVTGKMFRLEEGKGLKPVPDDQEPGMPYWVEHGETEWNQKKT